MIEIKQLLALDAVAQTKSIAGAARHLSWSQPTVTHHLNELGSEIGTPVILSDARGTALSASGDLLLPYAQEVIGLLTRAHQEISETYKKSQSIKIGVLPTVGANIMPRVLKQLFAQGISVKILEAETEQLINYLSSYEIDAAIVMSESSIIDQLPVRAAYRPFFKEKLKLLLPATDPLAQQDNIRLSDVAHHSWILSNNPHDPVDKLLRTAMEREGVTVKYSLQSDDYSVIQSYVGEGLGIALVPVSAISPSRIDVVAQDIVDVDFVREIAVIIGLHSPYAVVEALMKELSTATKPE